MALVIVLAPDVASTCEDGHTCNSGCHTSITILHCQGNYILPDVKQFCYHYFAPSLQINLGVSLSIKADITPALPCTQKFAQADDGSDDVEKILYNTLVHNH